MTRVAVPGSAANSVGRGPGPAAGSGRSRRLIPGEPPPHTLPLASFCVSPPGVRAGQGRAGGGVPGAPMSAAGHPGAGHGAAAGHRSSAPLQRPGGRG